jgi:DNA repair exonuclease SbcCD ATPase subunit
MQFPWTRKAPAALSVVAVPAPQTAPDERDELASLQREIEAQQAELSDLEQEAREIGSQLAEGAQLASQLKIKISEGNVDANTALDSLEREQRAIERRHEGLRLRISTLQAVIQPKIRRASELAQVADGARQDEILSEITAKAETMTDELLQNWRNACALGYDLMAMLDTAMGGHVPLDEEHKRQVLVVNVNIGKRLLAASIAQANERWIFARSESFHSLKVIPGKAKEAVARAG